MSKAGRFEIAVGMPYPVWCVLSHDGKPLVRFSHKELSDLKYAVEKSMQEARHALKEDRDEV